MKASLRALGRAVAVAATALFIALVYLIVITRGQPL